MSNRESKEDKQRPIDGERWLPIEGWDGYDVSDHGRVRSWWGPAKGDVNPEGEGKGRRTITDSPKIIGNYRWVSGHRMVLLYRNQSTEKKWHSHHVLVLATFVGPRPDGLDACHNNGDPGDNRLENLRWDTRTANQLDRLKHGKTGREVLAEGDIPTIWAMMVEGRQTTDIARELGFPIGALNQVRCGGTWSHITDRLPGWPLVKFGSLRKENLDFEPEPSFDPIFVPKEIANSDVEIWGSVEDYPAYRVSSFGRIQSCWEKVIGGYRGEMRLSETWVDRACYPNRHRYLFLWMSNGKQKGMKYVHQLVLTAFAGTRPERCVACHIDGNRINNRADNLRWDTVKANGRDQAKHAKTRKETEQTY